jgi:hypothetical protein
VIDEPVRTLVRRIGDVQQQLNRRGMLRSLS